MYLHLDLNRYEPELPEQARIAAKFVSLYQWYGDTATAQLLKSVMKLVWMIDIGSNLIINFTSYFMIFLAI